MTEKLTNKAVMEALGTVQDPELNRDLVSLDMIKDVDVQGRHVTLKIELTTPACPQKEQIKQACVEALKARGAEGVDVEWSSKVRQTTGKQDIPSSTVMLEGVKNLILIASGKGGVGKSTVAANLAIALSRDGARVGLLDADLYGPSIPIMFGAFERPSPSGEKRISPVDAHGIDLMSIGFFVAPEQAMIWRGPILSGTILQFLRDVDWGDQDYLIVDLPPGTGDVQLSIAQHLRVTGAVMVSTPQDVALADVVRCKAMFDQVKVPILGIIENMSYFLCTHCGTRHEIFSSGGGRAAAEKLGVPFLGELPLETLVREASDHGVPVVARDPDATISKSFREVARALAGRVSVEAMGKNPRKKKLFSKIFE